MTAAFEPVSAGYLKLSAGGENYRIYVEQAGHKRPVLCLHTAGTDSRQWRHQLNDEAITRDHRLIAFDLPWHGKSSPPEGYQTREYRLTCKAYMELVLGVVDALKLDRPLVAGCSIGARIALQLAALHGGKFSGFIAIAASDVHTPWYDIDWLHRPDAHGGEMAAALVSANISPHAPERERQETLWMFMMSGPGVMRGDLDFFTRDDSLPDRLKLIDTARTPVHILNGAYDLSCPPADGERIAATVRGAKVTIMPELGHFPMSEHPEAFRPYFLAALAGMAPGGSGGSGSGSGSSG